ncbi:hypothetical protein HHO41_02195 [Bacillus sp. DNRA2]|uniref:flagellar brake protein n=1 Tax=Bacillus sp. DNRA2 TaxID=2723053 RepID=UPI00145D4F0A|nr:flagellar brake domain-containing protein [Bacillus sp. DNRA2]NMD69083.1 hypothetical protein [Bacillus sp. DNRA2]
MFPKVNQQILIDIVQKGVSYRTIIAEYQDDEILIGIPMSDMVGVLPNGTEIDVTFKSGENLFRFTSEIIGKKLDRIPLYRIHKPSEKKIYRIQRRENFRVNLHLKLFLLENEYTTVNVSAGGLLFSTHGKIGLHEGQIVSGQVVVPNIQNHEFELVPFEGEIRRIYPSEDKQYTFAALQFTEIDPKNQTLIIQSCFEQQRKLRLRTNT